MPRLELSSEEAGALESVLDEYLFELRAEIARTDRLEYREGLKQREALVKSLSAKLEAAAAVAGR
jgi:hypothetical protein